MKRKIVTFAVVMLWSGAVAVAQTPARPPQQSREEIVRPRPEYLPGQAPQQRTNSLYDLLKEKASAPPVPNSFGSGRGPAPVQAGQAVGAWWTVPSIVSRLALSDEQQKKIEKIFDQYRDTLFDRRADLEKEEALLKPLLAAEAPDTARVLAQVDRVVLARGEVEKALSRMTLEMRQSLTRSQWILLQQLQEPARTLIK